MSIISSTGTGSKNIIFFYYITKALLKKIGLFKNGKGLKSPERYNNFKFVYTNKKPSKYRVKLTPTRERNNPIHKHMK